jgi:hypothetical protein
MWSPTDKSLQNNFQSRKQAKILINIHTILYNNTRSISHSYIKNVQDYTVFGEKSEGESVLCRTGYRWNDIFLNMSQREQDVRA